MVEKKEATTDLWQNIFGRDFDRIDRRITDWMAEHGVLFLRISLGLVYVWFGALKLFPGASPASKLIRQTFEFMPTNLFIPAIGILEVLIGLGFLAGVFLRVVILLMVFQMIGALSPIVLQPDAVWQRFPFVLTMEGQYMVKNVVLIGAAMIVGATVRKDYIESR